jgi:Domain of unknown function DUF1829
MVKQMMDEYKVNYIPDIIIQGQSIQHRLDFAVKNPNQSEKLIRLVNNPTKQQAELVSFLWLDIKDVKSSMKKPCLNKSYDQAHKENRIYCILISQSCEPSFRAMVVCLRCKYRKKKCPEVKQK